MDYVIDIQGFHGLCGTFLPKEVAVVTLGHKYSAHWIVEPPYAFSDLTPNDRTANNYVTCYHHGIEWFEGDVTLLRLESHLRAVARNAHRIITRGADKASYLESVTSRQVINLERESCPTFGNMEAEEEYCFYHGVTKEESYICAVNNAMKLKKWLNGCQLLDSLDSPRYSSQSIPIAHSTSANSRSSRWSARPVHKKSSNQPKVISLSATRKNLPPTDATDIADRVLGPPLGSSTPIFDNSGEYLSATDSTEVCLSDSSNTTHRTFADGASLVSESDEAAKEDEKATEDEQPTDSGCVTPVKERSMRGFCSGPDPPHLDTPGSLCCKHR